MTHNNNKKTLCQLAILALGIYLIVSLSRDWWQLSKKGERVEKMAAKKEALVVENKELKEKLEYVDSDEFVEKEARNKLNMSKENEVIVVLPVDKLSQLSQNVNKNKETDEDLANYQQWWHLFF